MTFPQTEWTEISRSTLEAMHRGYQGPGWRSSGTGEWRRLLGECVRLEVRRTGEMTGHFLRS